jgi:hypothetical protein
MFLVEAYFPDSPCYTADYLYQVAGGRKKVTIHIFIVPKQLLKLTENIQVELKNYTLTPGLSK